MSQQGWVGGWSPLSVRWGPPPWLCDTCKRTLPCEAFTNRPHYPLHGESVCDACLGQGLPVSIATENVEDLS